MASVRRPDALAGGRGVALTSPGGAASRCAAGWPALPDRPVRLHTTRSRSRSPSLAGAARGHDNALAIIVATGVGGGLVLAGQVVDGARDAGHVGHAWRPARADCGCGGRGCLEAVARGPALAGWGVEHGWQPSGAATAEAMAVDAAATRRPARPSTGPVQRWEWRSRRSRPPRLEVVVVGGGLSGAGTAAASLERPGARGTAFHRAVPVEPWECASVGGRCVGRGGGRGGLAH